MGGFRDIANEVAVVGVEFYDALGRWLQFRSLSAFIHVVFGTSRDHEANGAVPRLWWENAHARRVGGVRRDRSAVFWILPTSRAVFEISP